jgi:hypothetical protein
MIEDETLRKATELQIAHFGQIPMQLFKIPHPSKRTSGTLNSLFSVRPLRKCFSHSDSVELVNPACDEECVAVEALSTLVEKSSGAVSIAICVLNDRILSILDNGVIEVLKYSTSDEAKLALAAVSLEQKTSYALNEKSLQSSTMNPDDGSTSNVNFDLISFDDEDEKTKISNFSKIDNLSLSSRVNKILVRSEQLIHIEKELTHFDFVPRIPVTNTLSCYDSFHNMKTVDSSGLTVSHGDAKIVELSRTIHLTKSGLIAFSIGHADGRILVRELDIKTGFVKSVGEFRAHKKRVVSISSDSIPFANTDVIATLDESGQTLIWTVSKVRAGTNLVSYNYIISRRPQRLFRCDSQSDMICGLSWQMGVVVVLSGCSVQIFSIERDERFCFFQISTGQDANVCKSINPDDKCSGFSFTGPVRNIGDAFNASDVLKTNTTNGLDKMILSDCGNVIIQTASHNLVSYSLLGECTGSVTTDSSVTFLNCPDNGDVVISGHSDGSVCFFRSQNLVLLYTFAPYLKCVHQSLNLPLQKERLKESQKFATSTLNNYDENQTNLSVASSPVLTVTIGPNRAFPALIVVTTISGCIFFKALPDFVKWERGRSPSALAQLASVPLQAVRGSLQQAHNWTAETAGVLAQNARVLADDAIGELKKVFYFIVFPNILRKFADKEE